MKNTDIVLETYQSRIYYEDVDAGGICYHSKYLNFCERARSELFFSNNSSPIQGDYHFVVKNINADYILPALFGEKIDIATSIIDYKNVSITMLQEVRNQDNKLLFSMKVLLVCLKGNKLSRIPDSYNGIFKLTKWYRLNRLLA